MRRGDFASQCHDTPGDCLISPSVFAGRVDKMRVKLLEQQGNHVKDVIIMSGECFDSNLCYRYKMVLTT